MHNILVIGDLHFPSVHQDYLKFLKSVQEKHKTTKTVSVGDVVDGNSISFHERDPDMPSPEDEFNNVMEMLKPFYKAFPKMEISLGNHDLLIARKNKFVGLPSRFIKPINEILESPKGWEWKKEIELPSKMGRILVRHTFSANIKTALSNMGCNVIQGHHHTLFNIEYKYFNKNLIWGMNVGTLIDAKSPAFDYARGHLLDSQLGCGVVIGGRPQLIPMVLNDKLRWIGKLC